MKTLVIGGTLFIGRLLVTHLLKAGHEVTILHRKPGHPFRRRVSEIIADRNDAARVREALRGQQFEIVFDDVYDWERGTTAEHVEAAARAAGDRLQRYVFMSSIAAYGDGLNHREDDPLAPDAHPQPYVRHKAMSERALFRLHRQEGFPAVTLRPPFVYGPGNPFYREAFFWDRLRDNRPIILPDNGQRLMQFVHVRDLVWACLRVIEEPSSTGHAFNIGNARPISQLEALETFANVARKKPHLVRIPRERIVEAGGDLLRPRLYFGEYLDLPPITMRIDKAQRMLGYEPTDFTKGLKETYRWYLRHRSLPPPDYTFEDEVLARWGSDNRGLSAG